MPDSFDAYQYVSHLRRRWRVIAVTCATAVLLALAASLLLPKQYTATCRILIEPPATSDPRVATAVNPTYLESLRTYEHFASSDSLFLRALDHFQLRRPDTGKSVESWKRSVLRVAIPRSTKILEINATLPDARKAHALALYLAEETVKLNRSVSLESDNELTADLEKQFAQAGERLKAAETEWNQAAARRPAESVAAEIESAEELKTRVQTELLPAEILIAEDTDREKALSASGSRAELETVRQELRYARARAEMLRRERDELERRIARKQVELAERTARSNELAARLKMAQTAYEAVEARLREARATSGLRGERLRIIDPGIVPERPSFPNLPLNLLAALLLGLAGSLLFATLEFSYQRQKAAPARAALRMAGNE